MTARTTTRETRLDERLINRFDYDGDHGTVLNRFLMHSRVRVFNQMPEVHRGE